MQYSAAENIYIFYTIGKCRCNCRYNKVRGWMGGHVSMVWGNSRVYRARDGASNDPGEVILSVGMTEHFISSIYRLTSANRFVWQCSPSLSYVNRAVSRNSTASSTARKIQLHLFFNGHCKREFYPNNR